MHIHLAERRQALRQREPPTQGCAPPTCVCSRPLFLHPTQAVFNGKDQKFVTTILATDLLTQLLCSPPSQTVWSDLRLEQPFLHTPQTRREDKDAEEVEGIQDEDSRLLWRAAGQANADKSKQISRRARPERRKVLHCFSKFKRARIHR